MRVFGLRFGRGWRFWLRLFRGRLLRDRLVGLRQVIGTLRMRPFRVDIFLYGHDDLAIWRNILQPGDLTLRRLCWGLELVLLKLFVENALDGHLHDLLLITLTGGLLV